MLNINSCLQITIPAYVHLSQIMPYRLRRSVVCKRNDRLKEWDIADLLCPVQHFLSQSPPCQVFANVNYSFTLFFKMWGVKLVYQMEGAFNHIIFQDVGSKTSVSDGRSVSNHKHSRCWEPNFQECTVNFCRLWWFISPGDEVQAVSKVEKTIYKKGWDCQGTGPLWLISQFVHKYAVPLSI